MLYDAVAGRVSLNHKAAMWRDQATSADAPAERGATPSDRAADRDSPALGASSPAKQSRPSTPAWPPPRWLVAGIVALTIARLITAATAGFSDDDAYYRLWGLAPAWSYYDHAPMVGWWVWLGMAIAGDTVLGVRLLAPLATGFGSVMMWRMAALLFDGRTATRSVLAFNAMSLVAIGSVVQTPDVPALLFTGLALWALAEWLHSGRARWWLVVGAMAGLGLLSKYSVLFLGAGIGLWLLATERGRAALTTWAPWAGGALALVLFLPVIGWNATHEWASFAKQFGRVVPEHEATLRYLGELIGGQIALVNPLLAPFVVWGFAAALKRGWRHCNPKVLLIPLTSLPFLLYLVIHAVHDRVQGNWPATLYPGLAVLAAWASVEAEAVAPGLRRIARTLFAVAVPAGLAASLAVYVYLAAPVAPLLGRHDPSAQMRGWPGLAQSVAALAERHDAAWIATTKHQTTGQLAWALKGKLPVIQLTDPIRYAHLEPPPADVLRRPALYVELERRAADGTALGACFRDVQPLGEIERSVAGRTLARYSVWRVDGLNEGSLAALTRAPAGADRRDATRRAAVRPDRPRGRAATGSRPTAPCAQAATTPPRTKS